jgi:hypothetical protein
MSCPPQPLVLILLAPLGTGTPYWQMRSSNVMNGNWKTYTEVKEKKEKKSKNKG